MKNIFAVIAISLMAGSAFAQFDRSEVVLRCRESRATINNTRVVLSSPGITGRYSLKVTRGTRRVTEQAYFVDRQMSHPRPGSPVTYLSRNRDVRLTVNGERRDERTRTATLQTREAGAENLLCR